MATELKAASVQLVLDTKKALDQAEQFEKDEQNARRPDGGGGGAPSKPPSGGGEEGGRRPDASPPGKDGGNGRDSGGGGGGNTTVPGMVWDATTATWRGGVESGLRGQLGNIGRTIPFVGMSVAVTEFAAEYGPMAAAAARRAFGGVIPQIAEGAVVELTRKYQELSSRLAAIDTTIQQTKAVVMVQSTLWGGEVDAAAVGKFAQAAYRVNATLERARLAKKLAESRAVGEAGGYLFDELYSSLVESTRLSAGR